MSSQEVLKTYHIPPFQSSGSKDMPAAVAIYPPLGQVTQIFGRTVSFTATLDVDGDATDDSWEVALWHSTSAEDVGSWQETLLAPFTGPKASVSSLQANGSRKRRLQYTGSISSGKALNFTVKYRSNAGQPWIWARDTGGFEDGQVIILGNVASAQLPEKLENVFKDLNPDLVIKSIASQAPQTKLWSLEAAVPAAEGEDSAIVDVPLGVPWKGEYVRYASSGNMGCQGRHLTGSTDGSPWSDPGLHGWLLGRANPFLTLTVMEYCVPFSVLRERIW
jgi:hypothetical protein